MTKATIVFAVFAALLLVLSAHPASAQTGPTITDGGVQNNFPDGMVFGVSVQAPSPVQKLRLRYAVLPDGFAAIGQPDFTPAETVNAAFTLGGDDPSADYLAPGIRIDYFWEATDADGNSARSDTKRFEYRDIRFEWNELESSGVRVHYYSGSADDANEMLAVASDQISRVSQLLGASITFPVNVWAYESRGDMEPALIDRSDTYEQSVYTAGVRASTDTVLVLGNVSFDTLRHELTHVVTAVAGESALGTLPWWLDEGTAVYGEVNPGIFRDALEDALRSGDVLSIHSITSVPGDPDNVFLGYGEAWSLVSYLNDNYPPSQFAQLFAEIKKGQSADAALQAVYGFDQDGLEDKWRAAHDLPARVTPAPTQPAQATSAPQATSTGNGGTSTGTIIAVALGFLALAVVVGLGGLTIARRLR